MRRLFALLIACSLFACTKGSVRDARDPARGVAGAEISVSRFPPSITSERDAAFIWPSHGLPADFVATTDARMLGGQDNFGFGPRGAGQQIPANHWYRFEVSRPGYERAVHYRFHDGYDEPCETFECPVGAPQNCCHREDFVLWPAHTPRQRYPDLIVDARTLRSQTYLQCVTLPNRDRRTSEVDLVALRTTVRVANVGDGPLWLERLEAGGACTTGEQCSEGFECAAGHCVARKCYGDDNLCGDELTCGPEDRCSGIACVADEDCPSRNCLARAGFVGTCAPPVMQRLTGASGMPDLSVKLDARFEDDGARGELQLRDLTAVALVRDKPGCEDFYDRDSACVAATPFANPGCIAATEVFDEALGSDDPLVTTCMSSRQILPSGRSVTRRHDAPELALSLGTPEEAFALLQKGSYRLEVIVDPENRLTERPTVDARGSMADERRNNTASVPLHAPTIGSPTEIGDLCRQSANARDCTDCAPLLDCSHCQVGDRDGEFHPCVEAFNLNLAQQEMCAGFLEVRMVR